MSDKKKDTKKDFKRIKLLSDILLKKKLDGL